MLKNKACFLFVVIVVFFASCKTPEILTKGTVSNISDARLRNQLIQNELDYKKLYLKKVQFSFSDGSQKKSFKGSFVIQKDTQIVVSIFPVMGIELIRVRLTPNEVVIIDKHNKVVTTTNYDYFNQKYDLSLNFYALQAILTNAVFLYPVEVDNYEGLKKYKHYVEKDYYSFKALKDNRFERFVGKGRGGVIQHEICIFPDVYRIFKINIKDLVKNQSINIDYSDFKSFGNALFPEHIIFVATQEENTFELDLKINYLELNDGGSLYFKIPSAYESKVL